MMTIRQTYTLPDGREIESEVERRGDRLRVRLRLCRDGLVEVAHRMTVNLLAPGEFLPKEFDRDPAVQAAALDPVEEIRRMIKPLPALALAIGLAAAPAWACPEWMKAGTFDVPPQTRPSDWC
jgi:hypothetical protein